MLPKRKNPRLREFDYRQNGVYAVTICVHQRRCAFGRVREDKVYLHPFGKIAHEDWLNIPSHYTNVVLDEFVIMPNHIHGILWIEGDVPPTPEEEIELRKFGKPLSGSLASVIGNYKGGVTRRIGELRGCKTDVWQRGFYDHIIRHDRDLLLQREYIAINPAKWLQDEFF